MTPPSADVRVPRALDGSDDSEPVPAQSGAPEANVGGYRVRSVTRTDVETVELFAAMWVQAGRQPSMRELQARIGVASAKAIADRLERLKRHGAIGLLRFKAHCAWDLRWLPCVRASDGARGFIVPPEHAKLAFPRRKP